MSCDIPVHHTVESYSDERVSQYNERLQLAPLNFVNINVGENAVIALIDGGSELNIIHQ